MRTSLAFVMTPSSHLLRMFNKTFGQRDGSFYLLTGKPLPGLACLNPPPPPCLWNLRIVIYALADAFCLLHFTGSLWHFYHTDVEVEHWLCMAAQRHRDSGLLACTTSYPLGLHCFGLRQRRSGVISGKSGALMERRR